jgi:hypothetical protein
MRAEKITLGTIPLASPAAVHTGAPVAEFLAVALAAKPVGLGKSDTLAAGKMQPITIGRVVAVKAPAMRLIMPEDDFLMHAGKRSPRLIRRHTGVAGRTWKDPIRKRRRRHFNLVVCIPAGTRRRRPATRIAREQAPHRS